ncbi:hypothetical protein NSA24_00020 [Clostridioides mangenotii]|uniref:hypothetical protein n=1 Tax=Metaclostridioides mangenotii TaxID=1540 RepID=UPI00214A66DA|nr:hypothetical protein [Clostridioides mangenotii]MCR1953212.1 hypothetical protein [Clostridioides mangenotii]
MLGGGTISELNFSIYSLLALLISIVNMCFFISKDFKKVYYYINSFIAIIISLVNYSQAIVFTDDLGLEGSPVSMIVIIIQVLLIVFASIWNSRKNKKLS